jgi:hypothetical protein
MCPTYRRDTMKFAICLVASCLLTALSVCAEQTPEWVARQGKSSKYRAPDYITGFGMSSDAKSATEEEKLTYSRNMALADLASSITLNVSSEDIADTFSKIVNGNEELVDEYKSHIVAKVDMDLDGVESVQHLQKRRAYAFAFLNKEDAIKTYENKIQRLIDTVCELDKHGDELVTEKKTSLARETYLDCEKSIAQLEESVMVLELLGKQTSMPIATLKQIVKAKRKSKKLWQMTTSTMEEAAEQLALKLNAQGIEKGKVQINALKVDDSHVYSQFSNRFRTILQNKIKKHTDLTPLLLSKAEFTPNSENIARRVTAANGAAYLLSGSYFIKAEELHFYITVSNTETRELVASASARMDKKGAADLELKPSNYAQALLDGKAYAKDEITGGSLNMEVWTSKGGDGIILEDGDTLKIFARVNQPCYIRFIYHLCNGARTIPAPLYKNYFLDSTKVNRVVEFPDEFEICAPFGAETMQFFVSTEEFGDTNLVERTFDGEVYPVIAETLEKNNIRMRGLKKKQKKELIERRLSLTTVPK